MSQAGALNSTGSGSNVEKINVQTGTSPVVAANNTITFNGAVVAAGTHPVRTDGTGANTMALEVQTAQAIASTDSTKIGLAAFNSSQFSVDANGFVSTIGTPITTLDGNTGSATGSTVTVSVDNFSGYQTPNFQGSGSSLTLELLDSNSNLVLGTGNDVSPIKNQNIVIGAGSRVTTLSTIFNCSVLGVSNSGTATGSVAIGWVASSAGGVSVGTHASSNSSSSVAIGSSVTSTGSASVVIGSSCGDNGGNNNVVIGPLASGGSGSTSIVLGSASGSSNSSGSNNIYLSNAGVSTEGNVIRIGTQGTSTGQQNSCYIAGIAGVSVSNTNMVTINTSTGQLGSQAVPSGGITTINGNTGSVTGSTVTVKVPANTGTLNFSGSATTLSLNVDDSNQNTIIGPAVGNATITGNFNSGYGVASLANLTSGTNNTAIGGSLANITSGSHNLGLGYNASGNYTSSEDSNICLLNPGTTGESHVTRIGIQGTGNYQQNKCYIAGIEGATYSAGSPTPALTYCDTSDGQLVATQAAASSSATSTFGSIVIGTARQNTANYAILVNVSIVVTAATSATIVLGVGSTNTPSTNTVVTTFSAAAATTYSFSAFVPAGYYILVNTIGTITVGSTTTQACAIG